MSRILISILFALGIALAQVPAGSLDLDAGSRVTVTDANGNVIGSGSVEGDALRLNLDEGFSGFVTLSIEDAAGEVNHFDATVAGDSEIVVISGNDLVELADLLAASGVALSIVVEPSDPQEAAPIGRGGDDLDDDDDGVGDDDDDDGIGDDDDGSNDDDDDDGDDDDGVGSDDDDDAFGDDDDDGIDDDDGGDDGDDDGNDDDDGYDDDGDDDSDDDDDDA